MSILFGVRVTTHVHHLCLDADIFLAKVVLRKKETNKPSLASSILGLYGDVPNSIDGERILCGAIITQTDLDDQQRLTLFDGSILLYDGQGKFELEP